MIGNSRSEGMSMMFLGMADLIDRWIYSRQGVHQLTRSAGFPAPAFVINRGRTKGWAEADIVAFEASHPEVLSEGHKQRKMAGYFYARGE